MGRPCLMVKLAGGPLALGLSWNERAAMSSNVALTAYWWNRLRAEPSRNHSSCDSL